MLEQASDPLSALLDPELQPLFQRPALIGPDSAWYGHLPFAQWLVMSCRPSLFVELGTHAGISYAAFCEQVLQAGLPTRCIAVDTWKGDEHAGFYGEAVFEELKHFHDRRYGGFSRLLRQRFDEALASFADGSIDLLHIDGRHRLSDVTEDYESWRPKLSPRAVVLFHDTNVREGDFGVWAFWARMRRQHPSFEFLHAHGLGVLAVGAEAAEPVLSLCRLSGSPAEAVLRERFALLGERWEREYALGLGQAHIRALAAQVADTGELRRRIAELEGELRGLHGRLLEAHAALDGQAKAIGTHGRELAETRAGRQIARAEAASLEARLERERGEWEVRAAHAASELARSRAAEQSLADRLVRERAELEAALAAAHEALGSKAGEVELLRASASWRLTAPLRAATTRLRGRPAAPEAEPVRPSEPSPQIDAAHQAASRSDAPPQPVAHVPLPARGRFRPIRHVLFVMGEAGTPGATYRCRRNAEAMIAAGYQAEVVDLWAVNPDNLGGADLVVLWRSAHSPHVETMIRLAREAGSRVAFDVDDLMTHPDLARVEIIDGIRTIGATESGTAEWFAAMRSTLLAADFAIATTEELAAEMRLQRELVHVLPNIFDEATHRAARRARRLRLEAGADGLVRLGYAGGTRTHQRDFGVASAALARVLRARPQARLVLFREAANHRPLLDLGEYPELAGLEGQIEWRDMVPLEQLPDELARFDVCLAPLEVGNRFCEAKSELKFFEAALAGVCTVASPTGPYRRAIRAGHTGWLAPDGAAWEQILLQLVDTPELRAAAARAAYHDVLWRFGPRRQAELARSLVAALDPNPGGDSQTSPEAARAVELQLRRGEYLARNLPEVPDSELLFSSDQLGEAEVTVAMTSYNYEHHITEALESVREQTLAALDLAVVDDGSRDGSVALLLDWAERHRDRFNRIRILRTSRNAGLGGARNVVFDQAETPWVMALDSDNRLRPRACERLLAATRATPQAAFAYPRIQQFGDASLEMGTAAFEPARLASGNYIDAMALVAKWAWAAGGGYYVRRDAMGWEDFDLWLNLVELGQFGVAVDEVLADYRVHGNSMVNAITEQSGNKREMVAFVEARHPWLRLRTRGARRRS